MATVNKNFKVKNGLDVNGAIAATSTISASGLAGSLLTSTSPAMNGSVSAGTSTIPARADHVHPVDTSRAPLASPTFTGTPAAPTAAVDTNTTQLATTAFVIGQGYLKTSAAAATYAPLESANKDDITTRTQSGAWQTSTATTAEGWPVTSNNWYHLLAATHSNTGNYYSLQFAADFFNTDNVFVRVTNGSGTSAWKRVMHEGNSAHIHPFLTACL